MKEDAESLTSIPALQSSYSEFAENPQIWTTKHNLNCISDVDGINKPLNSKLIITLDRADRGDYFTLVFFDNNTMPVADKDDNAIRLAFDWETVSAYNGDVDESGSWTTIDNLEITNEYDNGVLTVARVVDSTFDIFDADGNILVPVTKTNAWQAYYYLVREAVIRITRSLFSGWAWEHALFATWLVPLLTMTLFSYVLLRAARHFGKDEYHAVGAEVRLWVVFAVAAVSGATLFLFSPPLFFFPFRPFGWIELLPAVGFVSLAVAVLFAVLSIFSKYPKSTGIMGLLVLVTGYVSGFTAIYALYSSVFAALIGVVLYFGIMLVCGLFGAIAGYGGNASSDSRSASGSDVSEMQRKTETEVWRMNGAMRENLKVSRDGERYYDPDDEEWKRIKK